MYKKLVAGTIILKAEDGGRTFLLHEINGQKDFMMIKTNEETTSLGLVLEAFEKKAHMALDSLELVELTSVQVEEYNVPLYVFEIAEEDLSNEIAQDFYWESPASLRELFVSREIIGVPILS